MNSIGSIHKFIFSIITISFVVVNYSNCQSIEYDKNIGAENAKVVEVLMGLYVDKEMNEYVSNVGTRLVNEIEKNPFDFNFYIADTHIPNAFALPGGYIYVTRGILALINTEDELAGILAHEIIHVTERHSVKQMRGSILPGLLQLPGNIVGTVVDKDLGTMLNSPLTTSNKLFLASYSRSHETEADKKGAELAGKAGYDPLALGIILERLAYTIEQITDEAEQKSYFDYHPYTPDRVRRIEKKSSKLEWTETEKVSGDFPVPLSGLVVGLNPSQGIFREEVFIHPDLNFSINFPDEWECFNQSIAVGAVQKDQLGAIFVGLEDPSLSPEKHAMKFEENLEKSHGIKPALSEPRTVNENSGYLISLEDQSGDIIMYIHILWLNMDNKIFKLIGIAPKSLEPDLRTSALSLRTLTEDERYGVNVHKLKIVSARESETLNELNERSTGVLDITLISLINGLDVNKTLTSDQLIKIVTEQKYIPE